MVAAGMAHTVRCGLRMRGAEYTVQFAYQSHIDTALFSGGGAQSRPGQSGLNVKPKLCLLYTSYMVTYALLRYESPSGGSSDIHFFCYQ